MNTAVESEAKDVKDVQERKETKSEAARRKKRAAEQLKAIEPVVNDLWYEAKYQTVPMFVAYFTQNQDDESRLDAHFVNYGLEQLDEKLQNAVQEVLRGQSLQFYELVPPQHTWADVPDALKKSLHSASYGLEPTAIDGVVSQVSKDATKFRGKQPLSVVGLWEKLNHRVDDRWIARCCCLISQTLNFIDVAQNRLALWRIEEKILDASPGICAVDDLDPETTHQTRHLKNL